MQLILAIDSDLRRSEQLANLVHARLQVDLVQATSAGEGLHALRDRVPDLILTSPLLSPFDDGVLDEYLRDLGSAATHVQTVRIPMLSSGPKKKSAATRLFSLGRKKPQTSPAAPDGCDPKVFADEIAHYLTRSLEERASSAKATEHRAASAKTTTGQTTPAAGVPASAPEPFDPIVDEWTAPDAMVQELDHTHAAWSTEPIEHAAPEPVVEEPHVPGSILDLRAPGTHARPRVVAAAEPEPYTFVEPEPVAELEPVESSPVNVEPVLITPHTFDSQVSPATRVEPAAATAPPVMAPPVMALPGMAPPPAPVVQTPTTPATGNPPSGNSASFEAALAAIRAAWAQPESAATPRAAAPTSADKAGKRPEKAKPRRTSGAADDRDGRKDWGVFDPGQYELSALVTKLDEVTESDEVGAHARTTRTTKRR